MLFPGTCDHVGTTVIQRFRNKKFDDRRGRDIIIDVKRSPETIQILKFLGLKGSGNRVIDTSDSSIVVIGLYIGFLRDSYCDHRLIVLLFSIQIMTFADLENKF